MSRLILIALPIGNLEDITERARRTLNEKTLFFVEDTRTFRSFLGHLGISLSGKIIDSFHDHSDSRKMQKIVGRLDSGEDICLVSEAGSPIISDPAYPLIVEALKAKHEIESIPGVSSPIVALELSGLPPHPFHFHAFLARGEHFAALKQIGGTHIFFEAPGRVRKTLLELSKELPQAQIVVARELTKKFQSVYRFNASDCEEYLDQITYKGEFVILVYVANGASMQVGQHMCQLAEAYLAGDRAPKKLAKLLAGLTKRSTKEVYKILTT